MNKQTVVSEFFLQQCIDQGIPNLVAIRRPEGDLLTKIRAGFDRSSRVIPTRAKIELIEYIELEYFKFLILVAEGQPVKACKSLISGVFKALSGLRKEEAQALLPAIELSPSRSEPAHLNLDEETLTEAANTLKEITAERDLLKEELARLQKEHQALVDGYKIIVTQNTNRAELIVNLEACNARLKSENAAHIATYNYWRGEHEAVTATNVLLLADREELRLQATELNKRPAMAELAAAVKLGLSQLADLSAALHVVTKDVTESKLCSEKIIQYAKDEQKRLQQDFDAALEYFIRSVTGLYGRIIELPAVKQ